MLVALPAAAHHYKLAYFGPLKPVLENTDPALKYYRDAVLGLGFVYTAYLIASFFNWFLFIPPRPEPFHWWRALVLIAAYLVLLGVYSFIGKKFATYPKGMTAAALLATGAFIAGLYLGNQTLASLTLWFLSAGAFTADIRRHSDRLRYALDFRNWASAFGLMTL